MHNSIRGLAEGLKIDLASDKTCTFCIRDGCQNLNIVDATLDYSRLKSSIIIISVTIKLKRHGL